MKIGYKHMMNCQLDRQLMHEAGFCLLAQMVKEWKNVSISEADVVRNENGKPYFKDQTMPFFNISHSGEFVVCVVSDFEVGIDIEKIALHPLKIAKRFIGEQVYEKLLQEPESTRQHAFCVEWTKMESLVKKQGRGVLLGAGDLKNSMCFQTYECFSGYVMTVCSEMGDVFPENPICYD